MKARDKKCVFCGNPKIDELESHHIFKRGKSATKYDLDNGIALCKAFKGCSGHWKAHNTYEMKVWIKNYLGEKYDLLDKKSYELKKWTEKEKKQLLNYFKEYLRGKQ